MRLTHRIVLVLAGLIGACGVAAAAAASHGASRNLSAISAIFLAHGPLLSALAFLAQGRVMLVSSYILAIGTIVFGADLAMRESLGAALFSGAAPLAGGLMILGWLGLAASALTARKAN